MFLTHNWAKDELGRDNHERVAKVNELLTASGLRVWFDGEQMQGDVRKKMVEGVVNSKAVVVFITDEYLLKASGLGKKGGNDNCKFEFDTAMHAKHLGVDKLIPVVMEPRWLGVQVWG